MSNTNIYRIQETYYFRTRIPVDLKLWFGGVEDFKRSLRTKNLQQARRLLKVWNYRTEETFTLMRCGMLTTEQILTLADNYKHLTLAELEQERREGRSYVDNPDKLYEQLELMTDREAEAKEALAINDLRLFRSLSDTVIEDNGLGEVSQEEQTAITRELIKKEIEVMQIERERMVGNYQNGYDDLPTRFQDLAHLRGRDNQQTLPEVSKILAPVQAPILISAMIDKFMEDQHRKEAANSNTLAEYASILQQFVVILGGDCDVLSVTRDTLRDYLDTLKKLPPHINSRKEYRGKTIQEIIVMNEGGKTISAATVEKNIIVIKALFTWLTAEDVIGKNPSDVLTAPKREKRPDEERKPFAIEDIQKLIDGLKVENDKGAFKLHPERYWLPILGLFTGMRLNEICQLHTVDVVEEQGIWVLKVQEDDEGNKRIKTAASRRIVPIHQTLIDLGFIKYVESVKEAGQPRLWMKLNLDKRGKYTKNFSNWFLKSSHGEGFLRTYVSTDPLHNFHSFRHTFANTLKQLDVEELKIAELVGHTNTSMTTGRYGKRYEVAKLKETMDKLKFEGLEFSPMAVR